MANRMAFGNLVAGVALALTTSAATAAPILWVGDPDGTLGTVDVATGTPTVVGQMGATMFDIAFDSAGNLWGISGSDLYRINRSSAATTFVGSLGLGQFLLNALVFGADGTLYATGGGSLYTINTTTGQATLVGTGNYNSSGDLAFIGGQLYLTSGGAGPNSLYVLSTTDGTGTNVGAIGFAGVYGLATDNNVDLYGVVDTSVIRINTGTGAGTLLSSYTAGGYRTLAEGFGAAFLSEAGGGGGGTGSVPEPGTFALLGLGLAGLVSLRRRKP